jgi:hypothetical protein
MLSSPEEVRDLFSKWTSEQTPLLVALSLPDKASFRFEGVIAEFHWPSVRFVGGSANLVIDLSLASFEYREPRDAKKEHAARLKEEFVSLVSAIFSDRTECFFGARAT